MSRTVKSSRSWLPEQVDLALLLLVLVNAGAALWLGHSHAQMSLALSAAAASAAPALLGVAFARGRFAARLGIAVSLVMMTALQIHLAAGALVNHFNVFVSMSVLLAYRDWRPIAATAALFTVHHVAFDRLLQAGIGAYCLSAPDPAQIAVHVFFVAAQAAMLSWIAVQQHRDQTEARELQFLINAMGRDGKIRLNLDVISAQTPAGQRLQHVQQRMAAAIREVHATGRRLEAAAQQVAGGSVELMSRTEQAATGLKDSAMCLDQIGIIVQHSTEASDEARRMSTTATGMANQGNALVADVVRTMKSIEDSSRRITDIIAVIDGIAFQTNILALNAAVEAARAGEQGRGFAVVASEVRTLAQRSAAAAKEIKSLIGASATTVEAGTKLVADAGNTMNELVGGVRRVGELFEGVTADTTEQMQGLSTVSQSITELSALTQQNVSVAEQASAAASELSEQAARLGEVLSAFNIGALAAESAAPSPAPAVRAAPVRAAAPRPAAAARAKAEPAAATVEFF